MDSFSRLPSESRVFLSLVRELFVLGYCFISFSRAQTDTLLIWYLKFREAERRKHFIENRSWDE